MPKLKIKTHSGAKKRFNLTKNGKVKRAHANKSHILNKKDHQAETRPPRRRLCGQDQRGRHQAHDPCINKDFTTDIGG